MRKLHTEREEAERLGLAPKTMANQRCRGDGPPYLQLGRLIRYDPALTDEWLAKRVRQSTSELMA
jgi:hypothetical protein